jgi:hypothetical protein
MQYKQSIKPILRERDILNKPFTVICISRKLTFLFVLPMLICSLFVSATEQKPSIDVSINDTEGKWQVEAKMQTQLSAIAFIKLLDSTPQSCAWMHNCKSVILLKKSSDNTREIQTRIDSPWPFSDRLILTKSVIEFNQNRTEVTVYVSESDLLPSAQDLENSVLIKHPMGTWRVSLVGTQYELSYVGSADADVFIPAFMLKHMLLQSTTKTFENIYALSQKPDEGPQ